MYETTLLYPGMSKNSHKTFSLSQVDENSTHQEGHWGYCEGSCAIPDKIIQLTQDVKSIIRILGLFDV